MNFQTGIGGWTIKILLALLIVSFSVWGIEDMLFKKSHHVDVAKIGNVSITTQMLGQAVRREEDGLRVTLGNQYSPDLIRQLNLESQVLEKLIQRQLIQMEAHAMGILPSDKDILDDIRQTPAFLNAKGVFDKEQFMAVLRRNRMSEKEYVDQLRSAVATQMLLATIGRAYPSESEVLSLYKALKEKRSGTFYTLQHNGVQIAPPAESDIEAYYQEHINDYVSQELRAADYLVITPEVLAKNIAVQESDLQAVYQERMEEFKRTEQRDVSQMIFDSEADAQKAAAMLAGGASLAEAAAKSGAQGGKPIALGLIEKNKLLPEAADTVFALASGATTAPIKSAFGWHIFQVTRIEEPRTLTFEEVKSQLEHDAKQYAIDQAVSKVTNQIEDALASGSSLQEVAKVVGLTIHSIPAVSRTGQTASGETAANLPKLDRFLDVLFTTDEKTESSLKSSKGGEFYLLRTETIIPEKPQPLADVRSKVVDAVIKRKRQEKIAELSKTISAGFADPSQRSQLISEHKLKSSGFISLKRNSDNTPLPEALLQELFDKRKNESTAMAQTAAGDAVIAVLTEITPHTGEPVKEELEALRRSIEKSTADEMTRQYFDHLKVKYQVSVDQKAIAALRRAP